MKILLSLVNISLRYCGVNLDPTLVLTPQIRTLGIQGLIAKDRVCINVFLHFIMFLSCFVFINIIIIKLYN